MKETFVLIFREGSRKLSEQDQKNRIEAVRNWALQQVQEHNLEPRVLDDGGRQLGEDADGNSQGRPVIALNFIEAENFEEAVKVAQSHPGLRYGVGIEVRSWRDPRPAKRRAPSPA
ncbi:MAG TPA: hypothetical protein VFU86_18005 [Terriglobales bacterium]|nr:hypothetical protein [Terriglobales bacterium]